MLGRGDEADYPLGADLYPFTAVVTEPVAAVEQREAASGGAAVAKPAIEFCQANRRRSLALLDSCYRDVWRVSAGA